MIKNNLVKNAGMFGKPHVEVTRASGDISMIGQFGGGLNSAYLVSNEVRVVSKSNDDEQYIQEASKQIFHREKRRHRFNPWRTTFAGCTLGQLLGCVSGVLGLRKFLKSSATHSC